MPSTHFHYPFATIWGDYVRAGCGLLLTAGPVVLVPMVPAVALVLAAAALVFVVFGIRTWIRHRARFVLEDGRLLRAGGLRQRTVDLARLQGLSLRYYSTRRDRSEGWLHLTLRDDAGRLVVESSLTDFERLLDIAVAAAEARDLRLSDGTVANLSALGYTVQYAVARDADADVRAQKRSS
jgi:hypothetical protein